MPVLYTRLFLAGSTDRDQGVISGSTDRLIDRSREREGGMEGGRERERERESFLIPPIERV